MSHPYRPEPPRDEAEAARAWLAAACDPSAFRAEQDRLRHVWTFLGFVSDAARDGDWFRASLGGRSVFVQRSGEDLRGFENRCAHRGFPIRTEDRGHGPIVCGLHHWRYDDEGRATGIPLSRPLFGGSPPEIDARLEPLEISACGDFVFGRFASEPGEELESFLGPSAAILKSLSSGSAGSRRWVREIRCNWRLFTHLTLDDYHLAAIHPDSLGKHGYLNPKYVHYERFGAHSVYCFSQQDWTLDGMSRACAERSWNSADYTTFQLFPQLTVLHISYGIIFRWVGVVQLTPLAFDRTRLTYRLYPLDYKSWKPWHSFRRRSIGWLADLVMWRSSMKVTAQDIAAAERLQETAAQMDGYPTFGNYERRIDWFEETYRAVMGKEPPAE